MSLTRSVLRNAAVQSGSQMITWVLTWVLLLWLPRELGDDGYGRLFFALSSAMVASIFVNLGIHTWLTKEVSQRPDEGPDLLANALGLKLLLTGAVWALLAASVRAMDVLPETRVATDIMGISFLVGAFGQTYTAYLQGLQRSWVSALALIVEKAVVTIAAVLLLENGYGLVAVAWAFLASTVASTLFCAVAVYREVPFRIGFDRQRFGAILKGASPYLVWIVFGEIYVRIDVLMLTSMTDDQVVGWYGAAFRLYGTLLFVPNVFMSSVFPAITRKFARPGEEAAQATRRTFHLMLLTAVPIGLGTALVATPAVDMLFGESFAHSAEVLEVFGISMVLVCVNVVLGTVLIASNRQAAWSKAAIAAALINPFMNWFLIPSTQASMGNGGYGAALATVLTEMFMTLMALRLMPAGVLGHSSKVTALKAVTAGFAMLLGVRWLGLESVVLTILCGMAVYVPAALLLRVLPREDFDHIADALSRRS